MYVVMYVVKYYYYVLELVGLPGFTGTNVTVTVTGTLTDM